MGVLEYVIIAICILLSLFVLYKSGLFKKKKSKKKKAEKPSESKPVKKEEPKPEPADRSFKIQKKSKLSRISKKALQTNARTGTVERVFERTPSMPETQEQDVYVDVLKQEDEELIETIKDIEVGDKKIITLRELRQKVAEAKKEQPQDEIPVQEKKEKLISQGKAGEVTGEYVGVHLGSCKPTEDKKPSNPEEPRSTNNDDIDLEELMQLEMLSSFRRPVKEEPQKKDEIDFSDAVVAEAILNPKFKNKKK